MGKRGKPLEVRQENDSITFVMLVARRADNLASVTFVLRDERDGGLFASIEGKPWIHSAS